MKPYSIDSRYIPFNVSRGGVEHVVYAPIGGTGRICAHASCMGMVDAKRYRDNLMLHHAIKLMGAK